MALGQHFVPALEAARLGADWAWAAIYREIAGPVTGFLRARGVDDPLEAAGDVFFDLSRNLQAFNGNEEQFRVFVFDFAYKRMMAARHSENAPRSRLADRVLDRIRRDVSVIGEQSVAEFPDGSDLLEVQKAFEQLTQEERDVLSLRAVAGLTVEQTAEVVHSTADSVKRSQRKAMSRLARRGRAEALVL